MIGILIGESEYRQVGIGTQVLQQLIRLAFMELGLHRVYGDVVADNDASIRLCERLGFQREGVKRDSLFRGGAFQDTISMALLSEQWCAAGKKPDA